MLDAMGTHTTDDAEQPAWPLGPLAEHFAMAAGNLF